MLGRFSKFGGLTMGRRDFIKGGARRTLIIFAFVFAFLVIPFAVGAQLDTGLTQVGAETGLATTDVRTIVGTIINAFLGLLGLIVVILFMYGGYLYMTAGGDAQQVERAKKLMTNAVIGLVIILSSYAIAFFIIQAITGRSIIPGFGGGGGPSSSLSIYRGGSSHLLGSGIIEYHYPETGQNDVPRNTNISITLKRPFVLSSIFTDYDDKGTFTTDDDTTIAGGVLPDVLLLNTDNIKIIPNASLQDAEGGNPDERFDSRYASAATLVDPAPAARVSDVSSVYSPLDRQALVMDPADYLGSSTTDVTYRVALRGGDNGVKIWSPNPADGTPEIENAFDMTGGDGGYYWPFTTGTNLDLIPPTVTAVVPRVHRNPSLDAQPRNQLMQIYFSEPMDATTSSGIIGEGGGFTNIEVKARCLDGADCSCWLEAGGCNDSTFLSIPGVVILSSRYRTAEFIPSAECEGVPMNSCGEPIYCLPENVEIQVRVKAADISLTDPPAARDSNGVLDMVGNSLDGNKNGAAEGPDGTGFYLNNPPVDLTGIGDTIRYLYHIGDDIDLTPPMVLDVSPKSTPPVDADEPNYPEGPFNVPPAVVVEVIWSKVMSASSMRTGSYNDDVADSAVFTTGEATLAMRASELEKANDECVGPELCAAIALDPPYFFTDIGDGPIEVDGVDVTRMRLRHRTFFNANDLGWSEDEIAAHVQYIPIYQPVIGAKVKDARQNCFYPSEYTDCAMGDSSSCCNRTGVDGSRYTCNLIGR